MRRVRVKLGALLVHVGGQRLPRRDRQERRSVEHATQDRLFAAGEQGHDKERLRPAPRTQPHPQRHISGCACAQAPKPPAARARRPPRTHLQRHFVHGLADGGCGEKGLEGHEHVAGEGAGQIKERVRDLWRGAARPRRCESWCRRRR